ncbi:hypothetical protein [Gorillibacterium timonense]|uniref:hypothetical protein n=1 Tax=Gorillibacterium timonense TaxID=1689269 RepID=UPI00071DACDF|nr:hypothetical protein [Gorillibacterium timonense]
MKQKESRKLYHISLVFLALLLVGGIVGYKFPYTTDRVLPPEEKVQTIMYGTLLVDGEFHAQDVTIKDRERISEFYRNFHDVRGVRLLRGVSDVISGVHASKVMIITLVCVDDDKEKLVSLLISNEGDISLDGGKKAYRLWSRPKDSLFTSVKAFLSDEE